MTREEMERAIEFLLQSQANFESRLEQTNQQLSLTSQQLAETNRQLQAYAETQREFIQIVTRTFEAQAEVNSQFRADMSAFATDRSALTTDLRALSAEVRALTESQVRADGRIDRLAAVVERHIREGHNGRPQN